jgi:hypothetical protein
MKPIEWVTPNKMKIETGHKTFDRQTNAIFTGNVISNTQYSKWIRPYNETKCYGGERPKGYLQDWDLDNFTNLPYTVRSYVKKIAIDDPVILYEFHSYSNGVKIIHGYVVTTKNHELLNYFITGPTYKSHDVILKCIEYVSKSNQKAS